MKKKVFSLMMTLVLAFMGVARAEIVEIGDGGTTTNSYLPSYSFYNYSLTQQIYTAAEIGTAGTINSIAFYNGGSEKTRVYDLYMVNTTKSSFVSTTDWITVTAADKVFSGSVTMAAGAWTTITLDTPFAYDGASNLAVIADDNTGEWSSGMSCYVFDAPGMALRVYSDPTNYDPMAPTAYTGTLMDVKNQIQLDITPGGGGLVGDQLFAMQNGEDVETVVVGSRPNGCWMEPFTFQLRNDGPATTVSNIDFTPQDYFTVVAPEMPFGMAHDEIVDIQLTTGTSSVTEWQMVAIYGTGRTARVWNITAEPYDPATPDVWELACQEATSFPFVEVPATAHNTTLHNDYTLPFPEIEEGVDAVYKLVFAQDQMLNAAVTYGANGKVALYTEDFYGQGGPMADNYYTGPGIGGGAAGAPFEAQIGEGTTTFGYFPFYTLYNYSIAENLFLAAELEAAGVTTAPMTSLSWYATNAPGYAQQGISIWMANVEDASLTTTSHVVTNMTLVYTGAMTPEMGWNEFAFNEGTFAWDGHSNILIYCQRNNGSWNSTVYWQSTPSMPFNASSYKYQDSAAYDATVPQTMSTSTTRPNIIMKADGRANRNEVLFSDTFEGGSLDNWTLIDADGDSDNWQIATPAAYGIGDAHSGTYCASSWSWNSYTLYPDNYMVSPLLNNATSMTYYVATNTAYPDHYAVLASTTGTNLSDFVVVFEEDAYRGGNRNGSRSSMTQAGNRAMSEWAEKTVTLPTGTKYVAFRHFNSDDMNYLFIDDVTVFGENVTPPTPPTPPTPGVYYSFGPVIENAPVEAGTYYLVASSTTPNFEVTINAENMPCPAVDGFAFNPIPADNEDEVEPASVTLTWSIPTYATEWRLIFGSTYHPEPNHPQTIMTEWSRDLANSYTVRNLWNNTNYFWRVEFRNDGCPDGVSSPVWGFTTHLNVPRNLTAVDETVFNDETITLNWTAIQDRTFRTYWIYRDGVKVGETNTNQVNATSYTDGPLAYNMNGYNYYVTAIYDEGESAPSNTVNVKVSGRGNVDGHVYEQDGTTGIAGATVTMVGQDEFGVNHTYNFTTNNQGYYTGAVYAGSYNGSAAKDGYQTIYEPVQGNPIDITYNQTTSPIDYVLDENFDPVCAVIAEYYPDSLDPQSPYVKVYWGCGLPGSEIIEDFETGDFSMFDWQIDPTYPWSITTTNPYEGMYCMKSGGAGVANVVSNMTVTVEIPADGLMSFFGKISCENNWDYGYFYIDGVQKASFTGAGNWVEKTFDVTAGDHTFQWRYTKDGSVNSNDDCFYVDYIHFFKQPEPAIPGMTYDFEDGSMQGWTSIDADGDGYGWFMGSEIMTGQTGNNGSSDFVLSQSYYQGMVLYPDNYLVSPQVALGGIVTFYACAQDASYAAEHFGVAVSTTNTNPSSFTMLNEWTMTAKSAPEGKKVSFDETADVRCKGYSRDGNNRVQGNWYQYTVDLSAYAGQTGYVAIRHFNCSDMFYLNVDDITISEPGKSAPSRAFSHYRVYRTNCYNDGPYTLLDEDHPDGNTVVLACELTDTIYIDVDWPDVAPGVYKWGVGVVYAGNRGELYESPITWTQPVAVNDNYRVFEGKNVPENNFKSVFSTGDVSDYMPNRGNATVILTAGDVWGDGSGYQMLLDADANAYGTIIPETGALSTNCSGNDAIYGEFEYKIPVNADGNCSTSNIVINNSVSLEIPAGTYDWCITNPTPGDRIWIAASTGNVGGRENDYVFEEGMVYEFVMSMHGSNDGVDVTITSNPNPPTPPTPPTPGTTGLQEPRESEIVWSNCLDKDMYMNNVTVNVLLNSADSPEGVTVTFTNLNEGEQELYPIAPIVLDETGYYAFETFRRGDYNVKVEFDGYETITEDVSIWEPVDLRYVMIEIIYGVSDLYVSSTGWAMWGAQGIPGGGGGGGGQGGNAGTFTEGFEGGLNGWNVLTVLSDGGSWIHSSNNLGGYDYTTHAHGGTGFAMCYSFVDYVGAYNTDSYLITPQKYDIVNGSTLTFWADNANDSYPENFSVCVSTAANPGANDFTTVWSGGAKGNGDAKAEVRHDANRYDNWRSHSIDLSAYAGQSVWIAFHDVNYDMYEIWIDDVELSAGAKSGDRHLESFKVMCTSIDGEPIYNANVPATQPFCQLATDELVAGEHYICKVAAMYSTGISDWVECEWQYIPCDNYAGTVNGVTIEGNEISWEYPGGGITPPPGPGDTFNVDFEAGLPTGWTVIDGNNDGWTWCTTSNIPNTWTYYAGMTLDWYHNGSNAICSGSYINGVGALNPDEYLVSPQVTLTAGSTFSFYAAATDASYPADHFGVFVSDNGTSDWTMVNEWTLTAKNGGKAGDLRASRDGKGNRLGNWYNYSVDLSAFAGQKYIAIRHFNCYDQYIMCVDDISLTIGAKGNRNPWDLMMTFVAPEGGHYGVAYDGNNFYTSNWGYSGCANNFYKYDLQGNMLEGFNIAGCGTLRGITHDGTYFYGVANSSTVYCVDLANQSVVSTFNSAYGAMRGITYDPVRDGFWVIGNWSGNLTLIDRTGAVQFVGPEPTSASDLAYYKDENDVEHVFCFNNGDNGVYDYNITTNTLGGSVFNFSATPGFDGGTSGGCTVGSFNGKIAFIGDIQQTPNLIGIYELRDDNTPTPPPTPTGDVLGAMIFADGEWEAFVPYPTNTYTYEGNAEVVCVRMVYNGTNNLPEGNIYYSMSCPECEPYMPGQLTCEAGADIDVRYEGLTDEVTVFWGEQIIPVEEWLYYYDENATQISPIGTGSATDVYWGIMFPADVLTPYAGTSLTKIAMYQIADYNSSPVTVNIFLGGSNAPQTLMSATTYTPSVFDDFQEVTLSTAVPIDGTQNLWITVKENGSYPALGVATTGNANARWISLDGSAWEDVAGYGLNYDWLISGFVTNQAKGGEITPIEFTPGVAPANFTLSHSDMVSASLSTMTRDASIVKYNVYRSTDNETYTMIGEVAEDGSGYYEYVDAPENGHYYYQVRAEYEDGCESEPALRKNAHQYNYVEVSVDAVIENNGMSVYPNPTKGNVTIEANGMRHITVVSTLGQVVFDADVDTDNYILNMSQFTAGMYTVRVVTENGVSVNRITVVR